MIYHSGDDYLNAEHKRVVLFGMSGLGKTWLASSLRDAGDWYHYSIDYRIGTRYMGEAITDNVIKLAMGVPFLRDLLMSDSIYIGSNISFHNLSPLSTYLGKPGDADKGGLPFAEYMRRQEQHRLAEINALLDTARFIQRATEIYGYRHFVCDSGGSICEVVDPEDPADPVLSTLTQNALMVWIKGTDDHTAELVRRFDKAPKPMYYQPEFLLKAWADYRAETGLAEVAVDPDDFVRWTYARALAHRQPRYQAMADHWGLTVTAEEVAAVQDAAGFDRMIAHALETR